MRMMVWGTVRAGPEIYSDARVMVVVVWIAGNYMTAGMNDIITLRVCTIYLHLHVAHDI